MALAAILLPLAVVLLIPAALLLIPALAVVVVAVLVALPAAYAARSIAMAEVSFTGQQDVPERTGTGRPKRPERMIDRSGPSPIY